MIQCTNVLNATLQDGRSKSCIYDSFRNRISVKVVESGKEIKSVTATCSDGKQFGSIVKV
ncbi:MULTISPECIES: Wall associated protein [Bacillus cereus group]|uniref:Wall associated protein n=1 Tax=Bacillus cereus TaxID=1396 RepID=A0A2B8T407_BACCE|nr:Wall associated protein [Bacillus cereus]PDY83410.1 Wall associated protein [Bacillus cereus]PFA16524.1 Wall associated protein [Bacillus cereus]PFM42537.1 Wall associated protein [Bacillus cereus]PGL59520.1 Wall associated protein [Bacillus cereus]PGQ06110.1 Wall associated protein [Bacillus cereus]